MSFLVPILFSLRVALRSPGKSEKSGRFSKHSGIAEGFLKNPKKRKIFCQKRKTWQVCFAFGVNFGISALNVVFLRVNVGVAVTVTLTLDFGLHYFQIDIDVSLDF